MSNRSDLSFRIEQYHNIEELLERARMLNEQPVHTTATPTADLERPEQRGQVQIAHPTKVDTSRQFDDNMRLSQFSNPEAFARNREAGSKVVLKTSGRTHDFGHPAHQRPTSGVKVGGPRPERQAQQESVTLDQPTWAEFGVAGRFVQEEAAQAIAQLEKAAGQTFSRQSGTVGGGQTGSTPPEQVYFDATGAELPSENTNVNYDYRDDSAWERVLAELGPAPGAIEAGEGAPLGTKVVGEVTKTFAKATKKG